MFEKFVDYRLSYKIIACFRRIMLLREMFPDQSPTASKRVNKQTKT